MQTPYSEYLDTIDRIAIYHAQGLINGQERIQRKALAKKHYDVRIKLAEG